ncbi:hypothetical protein KY284_030085 [Solanum tuberosum]|nr:hypothetical protein KY284_030085 [Solanum tuberosum]
MTITKIDCNHPLFIGPLDTSGSVIIPVKLTGSDNYGIWSRSMRIALLGKRKYGFVTGVCSKDTYKDEWQEQWETCNAIVLSWLMNTVAEELLRGIVYATNSRKVWEDLKERFDKARRQILLKSVSPTINQAYAMIIEDEIQHSAYLATGNQNFRGRKLQCEYCHLNGHTKDNCYKLIGYPTDWKHKKKNDYGNGSYRETRSHQAYGNTGRHEGLVVNNGQQSFTSANNVTGNIMIQVHGFTEEEYKQIMGLLNKDIKETHGNTIGEWIVDSGASHHVAANKHLMSMNHNTMREGDKVNLPTGDSVDISNIGDASSFQNEVMKNVLFVPDFKFNLLSVSKITKELSCFVSFYPDFCVFQDLYSGRVKGIGKEEGGLYIYRNDNDVSKKAIPKATQRLATTVPIQDCSLWHKRLGHPSSQVMRCLNRLGHPSSQVMRCLNLLQSVKDDELLNNCSFCPIAKQARLPFPTSISRASLSFDVVHMDLWGPYKVPTFDKKQYFLTVVDDCSRFTWVHLLQLKFEAIVAIKTFLAMIKTQFGSHVKLIRSDNGDKFLARAKSVVLMGYSKTQKGYLLMDLTTKLFFVSRDVLFKEHVFPFAYPHEVLKHPVSSHPMFPDSDLFEECVDCCDIEAPPNESISDTINTTILSNETVMDTVITSTDPPTEDNLIPQPANSSINPTPIKHTIRITKQPIWMKDYAAPTRKQPSKYPISNHISYDRITPTYHSYLAKFSNLVEPKCFREATKDDNWI